VASPSAPRVTDPLTSYRKKRDFSKTSEPSGSVAPSDNGTRRRFVVQRHRARRLHYDLRLEIDGVLVSWAVPKGPTLDPSARRAAFHVEDHPLDYFDFEGVIPAGEYGGGDVIVWDEGTWEPDEAGDPADPGRAVKNGELHFDLRGDKLQGRFVLVRTKTDGSGKEQWLLLHKHDDHAVAGWNPEDYPRCDQHPARRYRLPSNGTSSTIPSSDPTGSPSAQSCPAWPRRVTCWAP
jgi:bifunctional non-homologous end joining protein LigD